MREYSFAEQFSLLVLDGQDSRYVTEAKKAAVAGIAAALAVEETMLAVGETYANQEIKELEKRIKAIRHMGRKKLCSIEKTMADTLTEVGVLTTVPSLIGCDIDFYTAEITMRDYKCLESLHLRIAEGIKAEILEPGEVSLETICMMWLLRECGVIYELFSGSEQEYVEQRLLKAKEENSVYAAILNMEFHNPLRSFYLNSLQWKKKLFKNPYMAGVNLAFPFLDRRKAIFIDMVILGTTVKERREATIEFLRKYGHTCTEVEVAGEKMVKIDNAYYRIWPTSRNYQLPVQGVELQPVYR